MVIYSNNNNDNNQDDDNENGERREEEKDTHTRAARTEIERECKVKESLMQIDEDNSMATMIT